MAQKKYYSEEVQLSLKALSYMFFKALAYITSFPKVRLVAMPMI
jgi:hypothetical protein